jgi:hypothetical protein
VGRKSLGGSLCLSVVHPSDAIVEPRHKTGQAYLVLFCEKLPHPA